MSALPVTLLTSAAAFAMNIWLGSRIVPLRRRLGISVGDGGNEALIRRMRAQANFVENAPFFLLLLAGLELSGGSRLWLGLAAILFMLGRIAHAIGMDGGELGRWRRYGMGAQMAALTVLSIWAIVCALEALLGR